MCCLLSDNFATHHQTSYPTTHNSQLRPMHRRPLLNLLQRHNPSDNHELAMTAELRAFVEAHEDCFERSQLSGHVTASAWVVNPERTHVLLIHHKKLNKWLQPGGHCDGDSDTLAVAMKEVQEETGVGQLTAEAAIFDVDIHPIPENKGVPAHFHYDVRYLLIADSKAAIVGNSESNAVQWVPLELVARYNDEASVMRMVGKTI